MVYGVGYFEYGSIKMHEDGKRNIEWFTMNTENVWYMFYDSV